jgi:hypothetical protein
VQLGARSVSPDGSWTPPAAAPLLPVRAGRLGVTLRPSSAALVTVYPRRASSASRGTAGS